MLKSVQKNLAMGAGLTLNIHSKVNVLLIVLTRIIIFLLIALSFLEMPRYFYLERDIISQRCIPFSSFDFHPEIKYSWVVMCFILSFILWQYSPFAGLIPAKVFLPLVMLIHPLRINCEIICQNG
jgi:hypothetical protein